MTVDLTFAALADPTRRDIVRRLGRGAATTSAVARPYPISLPAVMKHLGVLERAGLVHRTKAGRTVTCALDPRPLREVTRTLADFEQHWKHSLDRLDDLLKESSDDQHPEHDHRDPH